MSKEPTKQKKNLAVHLFAGGVAGCCEALTCHPLDTIKVRLQLRGANVKRVMPSVTTVGAKAVNTAAAEAAKPKRQGFISVGYQIAQKEGFLALYKGLGAVVAGIVPKMAIRFSSFEYYKELLAGKDGKISSAGVFLAGLGAGATESVLVVTPMDVIKIRLQSQRHSMTDPMDIPKYRNAAHAAYVMIKEEGVGSLYKGVTLTILRQGTNQAANFTVYQYLKDYLQTKQNTKDLPSYQTMIMGFISGACGPLFNAPIDTIKTRIQKTPSNEPGWTRFVNISKSIIQNEGWAAFYKGLTPRVLRVAPGQSITFLVYERVYKWITDLSKNMELDQVQRSGLAVKESNE
ncbi:mitochondrial carrier domain-containing protein [Gorgonomyces haynaldii]|nr:mitochondrial carrier domain-containing protein [Gorgonomyces haynaldii]